MCYVKSFFFPCVNGGQNSKIFNYYFIVCLVGLMSSCPAHAYECSNFQNTFYRNALYYKIGPWRNFNRG